uniref:Uncharacterized protein n=1 Tax=Rhizophora mucronata TaxID=61149 RepID=A0A2P2NES9_RHIMU
MSFISSCSKSF